MSRCLACNNDLLYVKLDLGKQPLVNNLKDKANQVDKKYPLMILECSICSHAQISEPVDPKLMFSNYLYQTGASESHLEFFKTFVRKIGGGGSVLDIGCNDGSLLKAFRDDDDYAWDILGVEPAKNLIPALKEKRIPVINDFFPTKALEGCKFDCIVAFNVFAHNSHPRGFLDQMKAILEPNGRIFILTTKASLANYYHEHVSYFTIQSMGFIAKKCGLEIKSAQEVSMHNGAILFELVIPKEEKRLNPITVPKNSVGYGAAAGGIVLLNLFNMDLDYVVDDNLLKIGKFIPGTKIPIYGPEHLVLDDRDLNIVILAPNLFDEIVEKIKRLRHHNKDTYIHPLGGK
jgi:hypothetical protein